MIGVLTGMDLRRSERKEIIMRRERLTLDHLEWNQMVSLKATGMRWLITSMI